MYTIVGLGNPGSEYDGTRHNLGFSVIDVLCEKLGVHLALSKGEYLIGKGTYQGNHCFLVKPLTYMNNSGLAVHDITVRYGIPLEKLLVICDDFQLPLGMLRLRPKGSDGGHNGLYSIIYHLQSENFPRLRCGIASEKIPRKKTEMTQFVLSVIDKDEEPKVKDMIDRACDASLTFIAEGIKAAMNKFNTSRLIGTTT